MTEQEPSAAAAGEAPDAAVVTGPGQDGPQTEEDQGGLDE